ncbi:MAG: HAD hydrolase family protein [Planctomycetes bacterium]|nr:HAD hydrolase family protein [Planctomycetota bacterium]NUQ33338.1 HAD hydrolase family protein [Planctomycetaceae bacterium]
MAKKKIDANSVQTKPSTRHAREGGHPDSSKKKLDSRLRGNDARSRTTPSRATSEDFACVKLLILDVDGVLTDGGVYYGADGEEMKRFHIPDGMGIVMLEKAGIPVAVMTTENSPRVASRVKQLGLRYYYPGVSRKGAHLTFILKATGVKAENVAYCADDINDVSALRQIGLPIAVANAMPEVVAVARYQTKASGGHGAVREVCNLILKAKGEDMVNLWER